MTFSLDVKTMNTYLHRIDFNTLNKHQYIYAIQIIHLTENRKVFIFLSLINEGAVCVPNAKRQTLHFTSADLTSSLLIFSFFPLANFRQCVLQVSPSLSLSLLFSSLSVTLE